MHVNVHAIPVCSKAISSTVLLPRVQLNTSSFLILINHYIHTCSPVILFRREQTNYSFMRLPQILIIDKLDGSLGKHLQHLITALIMRNLSNISASCSTTSFFLSDFSTANCKFFCGKNQRQFRINIVEMQKMES
jgi:hypothetical protein